MADAHRTGEAAASPAVGIPARRTHESPRHREHRMARNYLKEYNGAVVLISHDRAFLDNVTTRTIEISLGKVYDYRVPYSRYVELRRERREQQMAAYVNQQKMTQHRRLIERFRYKADQIEPGAVAHQATRKDRTDRSGRGRPQPAEHQVSAAPRSGQIVVEAKDAGKSFGEKHALFGATFTIERGQKIALVGSPHGEGNTTFARMRSGNWSRPKQRPHRTQRPHRLLRTKSGRPDNGDFTVFDTLDRVAVATFGRDLRDILGAFLFRGEEHRQEGARTVRRRTGAVGYGPADARTIHLLVLRRADQPTWICVRRTSSKTPSENTTAR
ncbi:unnamed protein product [Mycena citricolor]|uniref:ABC-transporter extension domain-containing protein n=1 Tax=Mycena citricolor TaxID=2018698 RepID=A0AAD2HAV8_9AGAR|nr:unnamed protein product [Mycena citricolor]